MMSLCNLCGAGLIPLRGSSQLKIMLENGVSLQLIINDPVVQASNEETKEHLYETLLAECRDTIQAVREELKSETVRCTSSKMNMCQ